jgi:hypothetical protein
MSSGTHFSGKNSCAFERTTKRENRLGKKKINFSTVFAGQAVGIKEVHDDIWLVSFMEYDLGYFDLETQVLEPLENPFGPKNNSPNRHHRTRIPLG